MMYNTLHLHMAVFTENLKALYKNIDKHYPFYFTDGGERKQRQEKELTQPPLKSTEKLQIDYEKGYKWLAQSYKAS